MVTTQYKLWNEAVLPALAREGIQFLRRDWTASSASGSKPISC
jgi:hypothetical protein